MHQLGGPSVDYETLSWKNNHHARLYDSLAPTYAARALDVMLWQDMYYKARKLRSLTSGQQALELGIGAWVFNRCLYEHWFATTGIDISEWMINVASHINPEGHFVHNDFLDMSFWFQKFDLVTGLAFIHLFADDEAREILAKIKSLTRPQGIVHLTTTKEEKATSGLYVKGDYWLWTERFRYKYDPESFIRLWLDSGMKVIDYTEEKAWYKKTRMALTLQNK